MEPSRGTDTIRVSLLSETGPVRQRNEDRCGQRTADATTTLVAVADGVSGYPAADVASQMAVDILFDAYDRQRAGLRPEARLARAAQEANIGIYDRAQVVTELRGMATTLTAIAVEGGHLAVAHVGDSRLYLVRDGRALQLTKDHRSGKVNLTRSVGRELIVAIDRLTRPLDAGDVLVLCTDGLHNVLPDAELARLSSTPDPEAACRALVDAALARGADDNLTVAVVHPAGGATARPRAEGLGYSLRHRLRQRLRGLVGGAR